jgi:hypothetical protein
MAIALPLGVVVGRAGFRALADHYGLVPDASMPWVAVGGAAVVAGAIAVVAALAAVRRRQRVAALVDRAA